MDTMKKKVRFTVKVGKFDIEVHGSEKPTLVRFSGSSAGKNGVFAFWTAVYKAPVNGKKAVYGRAQVGLSAGDRFARMEYERRSSRIQKEDQKVYDNYWRNDLKAGANLKLLRPSTASELLLWLDSHGGARFGRWKLL